MKKITFLFSSLWWVCACTQDSVRPENQDLFNRWTWVQSCGGLAGQCITPASSGKAVELEFSEDGKMRRYENGTNVRESGFSIAKKQSIYTGKDAETIEYQPQSIAQSFRISNDTLFLNDECYDCYSSIYVARRFIRCGTPDPK